MTWMARVSSVVGVLVSVILVGGVSAASADLREIVMFVDGTPLAVQQQVVALSGSTVLHNLSLITALAVRTNDQGLAFLKSKVQGVCNPLLDSLCVVAGVYDDLLTRVDSICPILTPPPPLVCLPEVDCYPEGTQEIEADYAHEQFPLVRGAGVKVAIVDTGISPHQEFDQLDSGVNALSIDNPEGPPLPPVDNHGHGTAMAGTVGADLGLLPGIVGVAPKVTLVPVKAFDYKGEGYLSDIVNALQWVRDNDISVVITSFGVPVDSPVLKDAVKSLYDRGVIHVASAGNRCAGPKPDDGGGDACLGGPTATCQNPLTTVTFPAAYDKWVLSVGASDFHSRVTDYSLSGLLDVVAPGGALESGAPDNSQILSTNTGGGYGRGHGTSQAAAHAAGAIALAVQQASDLNMLLSFQQVRSLLQTTATPLVDPSTGKLYPKDRQGAGLINVHDMVQGLLP